MKSPFAILEQAAREIVAERPGLARPACTGALANEAIKRARRELTPPSRRTEEKPK